MIKVLTLGDPHFKVNNVQDSEEMTNKFVELAKQISPNFIVVLGDVLDKHSSIHVIPLMKCQILIYSLSQIAPTFVLVGNHDRPNNSNYLTDEHPFGALKQWKDTYIVDKVIEYYCLNRRFIFAPYVPPGKFKDALNTIENPFENVTAYFAHQEILGAKMGAIISQAGDEWSLSNSLLISGHVHGYDMLQPNMIYTGTPYQHNFGEGNKTVSLFTFSENGEWNQERFDLGLKKKIIIYLTPEKIYDYEPPEDKLVKLVIKGDESSIKTIAKLEKISQLKKRGVKVVFKVDSNLESNNETKKSQMKYKDRLLLEIGKDKEVREWFSKLFEN